MKRAFRFPWRTGRQVRDDVDAELALHLDAVAADLCAAGWSEVDARREAERLFGDVEFTRKYCGDEDLRREQEKRRMTMLDELRQDIVYAVRALRGSPGFTAIALLTLAIGIGANTAVFSVVRGVLLSPLPFRDADAVVRVWHARPSTNSLRASMSEPNFIDWRERATTAEDMGAFFHLDGLIGLDLTGNGDPERLEVALVTDGFFQTLGTSAVIGQPLTPDDHVEGRNRVVVLSHGFWNRRFAADPTIVGRYVTLNGEPFRVAGVMPPGFTYPAARNLNAWVPLSLYGPDQIGRGRGVRFLSVIARPKTGESVQQLREQLRGISTQLEQEHAVNRDWTDVTVAPVRESIVGDVRGPLLVVSLAVGFLLLTACVNLAGLLLARASSRERELAVRAALGAGRARIARQLLTESMLLACVGGALGAGLGVVAVRALVATGASELPRADAIGVDGWVLLFTLVVSVVSGMLFAILPTLRATENLERSLRTRSGDGVAGKTLRSGIVVAEMALATILVVGAALMTKSFSRLTSVEAGFQPENALVAMMSIGPRHDGAERLAYYQGVLEAIRRIPGVQAAGSARDIPLLGNGEQVRPGIPGRAESLGEAPTLRVQHVSGGYFAALGTPLRQGRDFEPGDRQGAPWVVVLNEAAVRQLFPDVTPLGQTLTFGGPSARVVGIVGDIRQQALATPAEPTMYVHALQNFRSRMSIVVRVNGRPEAFANSVRRAIWSVDPLQTITRIETYESILGVEVARPRLLAWLLATFGVIGLTLGALGVFGVLAYAVTRQQREIGVRLALGATRLSVLRGVVGRGVLLSVGGLAIGLAGAVGLSRWMQAVLYGIAPSDPWTLVQVGVALLGAGVVASWLPARRALAIDPASALRSD